MTTNGQTQTSNNESIGSNKHETVANTKRWLYNELANTTLDNEVVTNLQTEQINWQQVAITRQEEITNNQQWTMNLHQQTQTTIH